VQLGGILIMAAGPVGGDVGCAATVPEFHHVQTARKTEKLEI
jgi:hypothetical protein